MRDDGGMPRSAVPAALRLADADTQADLATFLGRAHRVDPDGATRLVGHGDVLACYVSPVHGGGGPVVLALRTLRLATPSTLDVTVPLAAILHRAARRSTDPHPALEPPDAQTTTATWAGTSPPRSGWQPVTALEPGALAAPAAAGIAEIAAGAPEGSGAAAVAALRARVWGRDLLPGLPGLAGLPAGVAFTAVALGYADPAEGAAVYRSGPWWRVTTSAGHVLARRPALLTPGG
jgi:hypothetical protein